MNRRLVTLLVLAVMTAAACSVARPSGAATAGPDASTPPATVPGSEPVTGDPGAPTATPGEGPTAEPEPTPEPTATPPAPTDAPAPTANVPSEDPGVPSGADACTGSADNRDFLESVARDMDWTVLCAVLPKGWSVENGSYRLANGGRMEMAYHSRAGATLVLSQGAFCASSDGCVPAGSDVGDAAYGPMAGTLVALDDGGWAIVVDRGAQRSWLLVAHGVDEATARAIGVALVEVEA